MSLCCICLDNYAECDKCYICKTGICFECGRYYTISIMPNPLSSRLPFFCSKKCLLINPEYFLQDVPYVYDQEYNRSDIKPEIIKEEQDKFNIILLSEKNKKIKQDYALLLNQYLIYFFQKKINKKK